jgi:hypothetical protein
VRGRPWLALVPHGAAYEVAALRRQRRLVASASAARTLPTRAAEGRRCWLRPASSPRASPPYNRAAPARVTSGAHALGTQRLAGAISPRQERAGDCPAARGPAPREPSPVPCSPPWGPDWLSRGLEPGGELDDKRVGTASAPVPPGCHNRDPCRVPPDETVHGHPRSPGRSGAGRAPAWATPR